MWVAVTEALKPQSHPTSHNESLNEQEIFLKASLKVFSCLWWDSWRQKGKEDRGSDWGVVSPVSHGPPLTLPLFTWQAVRTGSYGSHSLRAYCVPGRVCLQFWGSLPDAPGDTVPIRRSVLLGVGTLVMR